MRSFNRSISKSISRSISLIGLAAVLILLSAVPSQAHKPSSFKACAHYTAEDGSSHCSSGFFLEVGLGAIVDLKGKIKPKHAGKKAKVYYRRGGTSDWQKLDSKKVSKKGKIRWKWDPPNNLAAQDDGLCEKESSWHYFKFKIKGHGKSNKVKLCFL